MKLIRRPFGICFQKMACANQDTYRRVNELIAGQSDEVGTQVDSGKYLARGIALHHLLKQRVKFLWVTRDPRGVVHSFGKKVQSRRGLLSACFYYSVVNVSILVASKTVLRGRVRRQKYEDLVAEPGRAQDALAKFFELRPKPFEVSASEVPMLRVPSHFIGGNRLVSQASIVLALDEEWRQKDGVFKRALVYALCFPIAAFLGYRP